MAKSKKSSLPSPEDAFSTKENWTRTLMKKCVGHFAKVGWIDRPAMYGLLIPGEDIWAADGIARSVIMVTKKGETFYVDSPTQLYKKLIPIEFPID